MIWFAANILREPLDPWQQWAVIHMGELLENGWPRFRQFLLIVARQQGKTHLCKVLALYWLFVERQKLVFGISTALEQAKEAWQFAVDAAFDTPALAPRSLKPRIANGQEVFPTTDKCSYRIGATNRKGGRGKTIRRGICDELREQHTWDAYGAVKYATNAVNEAQIVYISNQGDRRSVVLNTLRKSALAGTDPRLGIAEYSAPEGTDPSDPAGWAMANPQLGRRMDPSVIAGDAARVAADDADPEELNAFLTEVLCIPVHHLNPAIDPQAWADCHGQVDLAGLRARTALVLDASPDMHHVALFAAAVLDDGRVAVDSVAAWQGVDAIDQAVKDVPALLAKVRPRAFGWLPSGPSAVFAAKFRARDADGKAVRPKWLPVGTKLEEISGETAAVCMGYAALVSARQIVHADDALLNDQTREAEKLTRPNETWVFSRRGGHCNAVYAAAGAVHLARTLPADIAPFKIR
ncbi:MAG TPA: hypothetical protein VFJ81_08020 [Gemmatimonadales bacterium]|nr:hypothetical protein [Gemmatimonadales bacterium]